MDCHFALEGANDGPTNMARDVELLRRAEQDGMACARVYQWDGPWVSVGKFENVERDLVESAIPWVRRPSGGKAVLHGHDLTIGMAVPLSVAPSPRTLRAVYPWLIEPIRSSLNACGLPARLAQTTGRGGEGGDCFAWTSGVDLVNLEGAKVCGAALQMTASAVLVQASVPARSPLVDPATVIRRAKPQPNRDEWSDELFPAAFAQSWVEFCASLCASDPS